MSLIIFTPDVWRCIGKFLSKGDLIALQKASRKLYNILNRINEIWYDKHNDEYIKMFMVYYCDVKPTKQQLSIYISPVNGKCKHNGRSEIKDILLSSCEIMTKKPNECRAIVDDILIYVPEHPRFKN